MLMDIETGRAEENKEKQPKPKKTNAQKRLIAGRIALGCFTALGISAISMLGVNRDYNKDIAQLNTDKDVIYQQFMTSEEFTESFKSEFVKVSNSYVSGQISYDEFEKRIAYLKSMEFAEELLATSNSNLKAEIEDIENQKQSRTDKYKSNPISTVSGIVAIASGAGVIGGIMANTLYYAKENQEECKKILTNAPGVIEPIKKVKYYDSTTMEMRNINGKDEDGEQNLTK